MFKPNRLVEECIERSDIRGLKGAFVGIIFSDRSFSSGDFDNTLSYIKSKTNINVMESFDNGELLSNKINSGRVTEDDFEEAVYNLKVNFSKERIDDVKKLAKVLYRKMEQSKDKYYRSRGYFHLGYLKQNLENDVDSAIYFYSQAINSIKGYVEAYHNRGMCYERKGDFQSAKQEYLEALKYDDEYPLSIEAFNKLNK